MPETNYQERKNAKLVFAAEYEDATHTERSGDDQRAARLMLLPSGDWANRIFFIGTVTQANTKEDKNGEDYVDGRVRGPTGEFSVLAGSQNKLAAQRLKHIEPPALVAITGKARTYEGYATVNIEEVSRADPALYDKWVEATASETASRIRTFGDDDNDAARMAVEQYEPDMDKYRQAGIEAVDGTIEEILESNAVEA